jgi:hypothetical protein
MVRDDPAAFEAMTTAELKRMCIDLSIAAALAVPGGAGQAATETDERFMSAGPSGRMRCLRLGLLAGS